MTTEKNNSIIVAFKVGRGGRFNNGGYLSFYGEYKVGDLPVVSEHLFSPVRENENGEMMIDEHPEAEWRDCNGNGVGLTNEMIKCGVGEINIDNEYESYFTMPLEACGEDLLRAIYRDNGLPLVKLFFEACGWDVNWDKVDERRITDMIDEYYNEPLFHPSDFYRK